MTTHSRASLAELDLIAAGRIQADAVQIETVFKEIDEFIQKLIKDRDWTGPDAIGYGMRWERNFVELLNTTRNLRMHASDLQQYALSHRNSPHADSAA